MKLRAASPVFLVFNRRLKVGRRPEHEKHRHLKPRVAVSCSRPRST